MPETSLQPTTDSPTKPLDWRKKMRVQLWIWVSIALVITGLSIGVVILPSQRHLQQRQQAIQTDLSTVAEQDAATKNLIIAKRRYDEITDTLTQFDTLYVDKTNPLQMIDRIEQIAEAEGVSISVALPAIDDTGIQFALPVEISLSLEGELIPTLNFIDALRKESFYIQFNHITISQQNTAMSEFPVKSNLTITTFWK